MKPQFELERNTAVINFSAHYCNTADELLNSQGFERVLTRFLRQLKKKESPVYEQLSYVCGECLIASELISLFKLLLVLEVDEIMKMNRSFIVLLQHKDALINFIEELYDYWRQLERYSVIYNSTEGTGIQKIKFIEANNSFTNLVLQVYRIIEERLLGHHQNVYRQLIVGANAGLVLNEIQWDIPVQYMGLRYPAVIESTLFELADLKECANRKPDLIYVYGNKDQEDRAVFYQDKANDIMIGYASYSEEHDYFGYMKKMVLTLYNVKMINEKKLPLHGAMIELTLKNGKQRNIVVIGDSGAGKSETLEAVRMIAGDEIKDMKTIFDDMGTLALEHGEIRAYGTEIGAFVRLDDLDSGYAYRTIDRSIFMNPDKTNARIVIPVSTYKEITTGRPVDLFLYANNYEDSFDELEFFNSVEEAKQVFVRGARKAKGTTTETGLVESYFANPFGPVQLKEQTDQLIDKYFETLFYKNIKVGQIRTRLAIPGQEHSGPRKAAECLLSFIKEQN